MRGGIHRPNDERPSPGRPTLGLETQVNENRIGSQSFALTKRSVSGVDPWDRQQPTTARKERAA